MLLGDYCMGPADHVSRLVGNDNFTVGVVEYFTKCAGSNPLQDSLDNITIQFDELLSVNSTVSSILDLRTFMICSRINQYGQLTLALNFSCAFYPIFSFDHTYPIMRLTSAAILIFLDMIPILTWMSLIPNVILVWTTCSVT